MKFAIKNCLKLMGIDISKNCKLRTNHLVQLLLYCSFQGHLEKCNRSYRLRVLTIPHSYVFHLDVTKKGVLVARKIRISI